jgi:hypothetical protein
MRQGGPDWCQVYLPQRQGAQLQCPGSQEQELPHWQLAAVFRLAFLRFFG